ncbi:hypothetical protein [Rhodococcus artemisiae]|uniref:C2H2-type domain-containing protein n=1 Tax=Rhodococcus artemisiae TaxID=714159 RepID=A0ABU7LJU5_9NOCA|nr:hypothetical protein [Rhodococcus artemisiae]MEE2061839.1 hypothetical protein [Rhodococcus artemisiae]
MTTSDLMSLWATCILPGCRQPVAGELEVCDTCRAAFGDFLQETDRHTLTVHDIEERDAHVRADFSRYALHTTTTALHDTDTTTRTGGVQAGSATDPTRALLRPDEENTERRGQRCWMCEQTRTCVRESNGWECRSCRRIR